MRSDFLLDLSKKNIVFIANTISFPIDFQHFFSEKAKSPVRRRRKATDLNREPGCLKKAPGFLFWSREPNFLKNYHVSKKQAVSYHLFLTSSKGGEHEKNQILFCGHPGIRNAFCTMPMQLGF
jgi:hypothetical protein